MRFGLIERAVVVAVCMAGLALTTGCTPVVLRSTDYPGGMRVVETSDGKTTILYEGYAYPSQVMYAKPPERAWDRGDSRDLAAMLLVGWLGATTAAGGWGR